MDGGADGIADLRGQKGGEMDGKKNCDQRVEGIPIDSVRMAQIVGEKERNGGWDEEGRMDVKRKGGQESGSGGVDPCQE